MLVLLRIVFGAAFFYVIKEGRFFGAQGSQSDDITSAGYFGLAVIFAIANAAVWAPYIGARLSDPLTGMLTQGSYVERINYLLRIILWLQERGHRRLLLFFCFLEGIHHPDWPAAFALGFKHAKPGSWLEKVFAREVFRFDNAQNCLQAYQALKRMGIDPGRHHNAEVNLVLMSTDRTVKPDPAKIVVVPHLAPASVKRNPRIRLFKSEQTEAATQEALEAQEQAQRAELEADQARARQLEDSAARPHSSQPEVSRWQKLASASSHFLVRVRQYFQGY